MWFLYARVAFGYDVTLCEEVDIELDNSGTGGDYWEDDSDDKTARGFAYELWNRSFTPNVLVSSGYLTTSGLGGCTPELFLSGSFDYELLIFSEASVDGNTIKVYDTDDVVTRSLAVDSVLPANWSPTGDGEVWGAPLDGMGDDRWNLLAMASWALLINSGGVTGETFRIFDENCCQGSHLGIYLGDKRNKFTVTHEIGHAVSMFVDDGGNLSVKDYDAGLQNCNGNDGSPAANPGHGILTREYYSAAIVEAIADWYSALVWNNFVSESDCEYMRGYDIDWNNDGSYEVQENTPYSCIGDPSATSPIDDEDLLEDWVNGGLGSCTGSLNRVTFQYDTLRYLVAMRLTEGLANQQIWNLWDDADPHNWDADGGGDTGDDPQWRWLHSAEDNFLDAEHLDQDEHGMDHY